jgi:hypothetical protein
MNLECNFKYDIYGKKSRRSKNERVLQTTKLFIFEVYTNQGGGEALRQRQYYYYDSVFLLATVLYFLSSDVFILFTVSFLVFSNPVLFPPVFPGLKGSG